MIEQTPKGTARPKFGIIWQSSLAPQSRYDRRGFAYESDDPVLGYVAFLMFEKFGQ